MNAFYEDDERILVHAADPYHRIDIRRTSRHFVVRDGDQLVADTHAPLALYESGFAQAGTSRARTLQTTRTSRSKGKRFARTRASRRTTTSATHDSPPGRIALHSKAWRTSQT
jgi:hypothetical protein